MEGREEKEGVDEGVRCGEEEKASGSLKEEVGEEGQKGGGGEGGRSRGGKG